jgi:deoxyribodipyrimidine photo-lyase
MTAFRRLSRNFALDRAVERARELGKPLLIFEAIRCGYRWASDRFHKFVLDGMAEHARALSGSGIGYFPYVEPLDGAGSGLLEALAAHACLVVADDAPIFFLPRMLAVAAGRSTVRMEAVDSNGLLPLRAADKVHLTAYSLRRFLQGELPRHLGDLPAAEPFAGEPLPQFKGLPKEVTKLWPMASAEMLPGTPAALRSLPIDHAVMPVAEVRGGEAAARARLAHFLTRNLARYGEARNEPAEEVTSGLSPYLHFGHISTAEILTALAAQERWTPAKIGPQKNGKKEGWWGMSAAAESFLDELVTWRELGYNHAWQRDDIDRYESLPLWARDTLEAHANDPRTEVYSLAEFEAAKTRDQIWNAAQTQLVREGTIHNYLRMLWGKKVLHWSESPREAVEILIELNNKYALDGRNPNSYSGIFWCLGRYDRPWAPIRPIFGAIRYMSSDSTRRKLKLDRYLARYSPRAPGSPGRQGELF